MQGVAADPSHWVHRWVHLLPAGARVLDVACGSGRHLRWLAARGFKLTGVDRNADALAALRSVAEVVVADIEGGPWPLSGRRFDAVLVTNYLWRPLLPTLVDSVADGGLLIYETFADGQQTVGRPSRPDFLLQPGELIAACAGLRVLAYEDGFLSEPDRFVQRIVAARSSVARPATPWTAHPGPAAKIRRLTRKVHRMTPIVGSIVALVTPMHEDGSVDYAALRRLIDWHIAEGTDCIGVVGTTGESPTVNVEEHCEIIRVSVEHAAGRVPIMAGAGGNATSEAIELTRFAKQVGADCSLQVVPYYNKPSQEGIYRHFRAVAEAVDLPVVLYNVPGRTVADVQHDTVMRLAQVPGIVAIKEATGNIERAAWLIKHAPKGFSIYSGDDGTAVALMLLGGHGNVSVTANVAPRLMHELCSAAIEGDLKRATALHLRLLSLHRQLFCEPSPAPTKWAMSRLGLCEPHVRLPILPLTEAGQALVEQALRDGGLLA
jgi:4-hydroxy-tetrahydrodipicolinate synthase